MNLKRFVTLVALVGLIVASVYGYRMYTNAFSNNVENWGESEFLYIPANSSYLEVRKIIEPYLKDMGSFDEMAEQSKYAGNVISGRFRIKNGMSNYDLIQALRRNVPVRLTFNNQERLENLVSRMSSQIEPDSISLMESFTEPEFLKESGFTPETVLACFLPNTYEFYWDVNPLKVRNTLHKEYLRFWNGARREKAEALGLTPVEVAILASIVQKETSKDDEKAAVAGVYLNRLKIGMPLQADPTVVFAKKLYTNDFDQVIKRVYHKDLDIPSPYNTYRNVGLPPGLIFMPDVSSIDAVLDAEKHEYLYFCASVERMGYHEFAASLAQHNVNSQRYQKWLNSQGIQ